MFHFLLDPHQQCLFVTWSELVLTLPWAKGWTRWFPRVLLNQNYSISLRNRHVSSTIFLRICTQVDVKILDRSLEISLNLCHIKVHANEKVSSLRKWTNKIFTSTYMQKFKLKYLHISSLSITSLVLSSPLNLCASRLGFNSPFLLTAQVDLWALFPSQTSPFFLQEKLSLLVPLTFGNTNVSTHGTVQLLHAQKTNSNYSWHQICNLSWFSVQNSTNGTVDETLSLDLIWKCTLTTITCINTVGMNDFCIINYYCTSA